MLAFEVGVGGAVFGLVVPGPIVGKFACAHGHPAQKD